MTARLLSGAILSLSLVAAQAQRGSLAAAKVAEAKSTIGAISRAAVAAYERETFPPPGHQLCKSSIRVPDVPPRGTKYTPKSADGADFNTGSDTTGWKSLKFALTEPIYYAYKYETGSGSGKSGATASGFEVAAQGDLNGNGVFSFFARGADVRNGNVVLSTEVYIENEYE